MKRLVNESPDRALAAQLEAEVEAFARCAATRDFAEGVTAFVEKRKPVFKGGLTARAKDRRGISIRLKSEERLFRLRFAASICL